MSKIPPHQAFWIVVGVALVGVLSFNAGRKWLARRFKTFDFFFEYFEAMRLEFSNVFWGVGVGAGMPYLTYALYSQFAYPPPLVNWLAIVGAVFLGGYYLWHADHLRLQKQLAVVGISAYPFTTADGHVANVYDINITNNSEAMTIHGVQVKLREISPQVEHHNWLPVLLRQKHDNPDTGIPYKEFFDLNPGDLKQIDVVTAVAGGEYFAFQHIVGGNVNRNIPAGSYRIKIEITATHTPPLSKWLRLWIDDGGISHCEIVENGADTTI
jgi:hypothetical protein